MDKGNKGAGCGLIKPGGDRYGYMGHFRAPANVKEGHNTGAPRQVKNPNYGGVKPGAPKPAAGGAFKPVAPKVGGGQLRGKAKAGKMAKPTMKQPKAPKAAAPKQTPIAAPQAPKPAMPVAPRPQTPIASRPTMSTPTLSGPTMSTPKLGGLLTPSTYKNLGIKR